eukprot:CAMPEP_0185025198 /NCGR_PEP_ID=MMETSP1103-20130426/8250_1 /TAXON_ID=36769 /ORGANISM="Paraphysomonas bandaiensis, Strain Caron Lab Isolate" /LENGTH=429 /DNA_ID=CAMNT_0027558347 /DNA_START=82 /DNA_END=1371 /DNA_ORIENTATION=+
MASPKGGVSLSWRAYGDTDIGGSRENQDDMFIFDRPALGICVLGVLDGHGRDVGQTASETGRKFLLSYFEEHVDELLEDPYTCLVQGIVQSHEAIRESFIRVLRGKGWEVQNTAEEYLVKRKSSSHPWACVHGGTSCSLVALVNTTLYTANVGDSSGILCSSRAILAQSMVKHVGDSAIGNKRHPNMSTDDTPVSTVVLTAEHSPESPEEFIRMRNFRHREGDPTQPSLLVVYDASTHDKSRCSPVFSLDANGDPVVTNRGSYYKNVRHEWASLVAAPSYARFQDALAFTRSIGDFHLHLYGVTHYPEVTSIDLKPIFESLEESNEDLSSQPYLAVVLASDGIWDNWEYDDVTSFVVNPELRSKAKRIESKIDESSSTDEEDGLKYTKHISKALIDANAVHANRNFGNQADNATGIVMIIQPCTSGSRK